MSIHCTNCPKAPRTMPETYCACASSSTRTNDPRPRISCDIVSVTSTHSPGLDLWSRSRSHSSSSRSFSQNPGMRGSTTMGLSCISCRGGNCTIHSWYSVVQYNNVLYTRCRRRLDGLRQYCSICIANALVILQSSKPILGLCPANERRRYLTL